MYARQNDELYNMYIALYPHNICGGAFSCRNACQNGRRYLHIEAEDMVRFVDVAVNDVATASGGKVLFIPGNGVTNASEFSENPSCMASFYVNTLSRYAVWLRVKTGPDGTTFLYDTEGNGNIK